MKQIFIMLIVCAYSFKGMAQNITTYTAPNSSYMQSEESKELRMKLRKLNSEVRIKSRKDKVTDEEKKEDKAKRTLYRAQLKKEDSIRMVPLLKKLNEQPNFIISGMGGVSNLESLDQSGGNFALTTKFRIGKFKNIGSNGWVDPTYIYMAFNTRTNSSEDSGSLTKSFLFPDISKRDFVLGAYFSFQHPETGWAIEPTMEFSLNRHKIVNDSVSKSFASESALFGIKFSKILRFNISKDTSYDAGFILYPYYSIINVQAKNFSSYNDVMSEGLVTKPYMPATLHSIGLQAGITLSKLQLVANAKYILNKENPASLPDLKGFTYTISTVIAVDMLRFNLF